MALASLAPLVTRLGSQEASRGDTAAGAVVSVHVRARTAGGRPIEGAVVRSGGTAARTDAVGEAALRLPAGPATISVRRIGFAPDTIRVVLRASADTTLVAELVEQAAAISPVVVTSTRAERRLEEEPLRVEVLAGEDVSEKTQMRPAELRTLLREMSGVRVQTTSPALGASTVRVQGLPGRYTLILSDGLPLYGGQASGFSLVQLPPLDLRQAEVIKGAASALYGPSATGGVLNLVSRRPPDTSQALANQSSLGGTDLLGFVARPLRPSLGLTVLGGVHRQRISYVNGDAWSDVPGFRRAELRPRLFYDDSAGRALMVTAGTFAEERGGGAPAGGAAPAGVTPFRDSLATRHGDVGLVARLRLSDRLSLAVRASGSAEARRRRLGDVRERERRSTLFGELSATALSRRSVLVSGLAWQREAYANRDVPRFDDVTTTPALFVQETLTPAPWLSSTLNGRCDVSGRYETVCTPRASLLVRPTAAVSARVSAGGGWFAPSVHTEETEAIGLSRVAPLAWALVAERARTASFDLTVTHGPLQANGTLFANRVSHPVVLRGVSGDSAAPLELVNALGPLRTWGGELFAVFNREPVVATLSYAVTRSRETSAETGRTGEAPLTPRQEAGLDLAFEEDESGTNVAVEVYYTGRQALEDNPYRSVSRPFTTIGVLASQRVGRATVFVSADNLTDVRQSRFDPLLLPRPGAGGRRTVDAWAPLEGRAVNAGVRVSF